MKHIWTVICEKSSVDKETNLLSMFNCIEQMNLTLDKEKVFKKEGLIVKVDLQLVSFWIIENHNKENILEFKVEIISPDGNSLSSYINKVNIAKGILRFRNIVNIRTFKIAGEGRYKIKMMYKKEKGKDFIPVAELPLDVKILYKLPDFSKKYK